jgi:hypothetical protein
MAKAKEEGENQLSTKQKSPPPYKVELTKREADIIQHALKALLEDNPFSKEEHAEVSRVHIRFILGDWKK